MAGRPQQRSVLRAIILRLIRRAPLYVPDATWLCWAGVARQPSQHLQQIQDVDLPRSFVREEPRKSAFRMRQVWIGLDSGVDSSRGKGHKWDTSTRYLSNQRQHTPPAKNYTRTRTMTRPQIWGNPRYNASTRAPDHQTWHGMAWQLFWRNMKE